MANAIKWEAVWTSRSTVLTTELNALAAAARTVVGTEIDNGTNLDQYGKLELSVDFVSAPTAGGYFQIHMVTAPGGTNYESGSDSIDPGTHTVVAVIPVIATTAAQLLMSPVFVMQPAKTKFLLLNSCSQAFPNTGSTLTLYTCNDEVQ